MLASSKPIHCFSPLSRKLDVGWPRIEDFQLRGHSCVNNVQRCLCHFYTWMRHSKQTATLLLTKRYDNFDTSTSAKGLQVERSRACNAKIIQHGKDIGEAKDLATKKAEEEGLQYVNG